MRPRTSSAAATRDGRGAGAAGRGAAAPGARREVAAGAGRAARRRGRGRARGWARPPAAPPGSRCGRPAGPRHAEGAGDSGLSRLIELHAFNAAGDAAVAISLAGTLFFQVPTDQARGQVALFLGLTMLPFAIVAPLIGPFLDRFSHGRRWAIGATMAMRAFLCWVLADAVGPRLGGAVPRGARLPGGVQGVRRDPGRRRTPAAAPPSSPWSRPTPGSRWPASSGPRSRRRSPRWRRRSGRSGRCATRSWCSSARRSWRSCCRPGWTARPGEERRRAGRRRRPAGAGRPVPAQRGGRAARNAGLRLLSGS